MPPRKRGRPARPVGPARPSTPTYQPVFAKPKAVPKPKHVEPSDIVLKSEPSFFDFLPPEMLGAIAPTPGSSSMAAPEEDNDIIFLCGPISGPESEDGDAALETSIAGPSTTPAPPLPSDHVPMSIDIQEVSEMFAEHIADGAVLESSISGPSITPAPPSASDHVRASDIMQAIIRAPSHSPDADDELDDIEHILERLDKEGKILRKTMMNLGAQMMKAMEDLDDWRSLLDSYRKSKKFN